MDAGDLHHRLHRTLEERGGRERRGGEADDGVDRLDYVDTFPAGAGPASGPRETPTLDADAGIDADTERRWREAARRRREREWRERERQRERRERERERERFRDRDDPMEWGWRDATPRPLRFLYGSARRWYRDGTAALLRGGPRGDAGGSEGVGVGVAVLAIFLLQFRGTTLASLRQTRKRLRHRGDDVLDWARSFVFATLDFFLRLRLLLPSWTGTVPGAVGRGAGRGEGRRRRRRLYGIGGSGGEGVLSRSSSSALPELEVVPPSWDRLSLRKDNGHMQLRLGVANEQLGGGSRNIDCDDSENWEVRYDDDIEPAFLRDEDYPPGWLVYHPIHGVIEKKLADKLKMDEKTSRETAEQ